VLKAQLLLNCRS